jgi:hypothetical protein
MEKEADELDRQAREGLLPPECIHTSVGRGGNPRRTKMFFGARCTRAAAASCIVTAVQDLLCCCCCCCCKRLLEAFQLRARRHD